MEPRPVSDRPLPAYPTRREFLAAGAAALAAAGISGCGTAQGATTLVAPVFAHGEGRGATGCVVVSPPVFLSEEEALQVVKEELGKSGIALGEGMPLAEVTVEYEDPDMRWMRSQDNWLGDPPAKVSKPADLAAVDRSERVGVDIVTAADCDRFRGPVCSTASSYDAKGLAETIAQALRAQAKQDLRVGVFYDPMERVDFEQARESAAGDDASRDFAGWYDRTMESMKEKSRAELRRQVQDFLAWLKKNR